MTTVTDLPDSVPSPDTDPRASDDARSPWLPDPVPAERFHPADEASAGWANINRAPYDRVSGVVYKRAANISIVRYDPFPLPGLPPLGDGNDAPLRAGMASPICRHREGAGAVDVRWLFSEQPGTQEGLLVGRTFSALQDVTLDAGACTGEAAASALDTLVYVIEGRGDLLHRPATGSPILSRPLRPGDAALIAGGELYAVSNAQGQSSLRVIVLTLQTAQTSGVPQTGG